jgi:two-component system chemotaxis response regulator CheY
MASILLIDDDENLRIMIVELLRSAGHTVDTADDGKTGLALYKATLHDLVVTDIVMAEMDGLKLIDELRQMEPRPRVIAISGGHKFSQPVYLPAAKRLGAERILAKPIMPDVFLQTVADVLAKPAPASVRSTTGRDGSADRDPSKT